jgi:hypothetical protein
MSKRRGAGDSGSGVGLYRKVSRLPFNEQSAFWEELINDEKSHIGRQIQCVLDWSRTKNDWLLGLFKKLQKHRRPVKNAERDAEIMRLNHIGKTAGEIVLALANRWALTDKRVNAVISRERKKKRSVK